MRTLLNYRIFLSAGAEGKVASNWTAYLGKFGKYLFEGYGVNEPVLINEAGNAQFLLTL